MNAIPLPLYVIGHSCCFYFHISSFCVCFKSFLFHLFMFDSLDISTSTLCLDWIELNWTELTKLNFRLLHLHFISSNFCTMRRKFSFQDVKIQFIVPIQLSNHVIGQVWIATLNNFVESNIFNVSILQRLDFLGGLICLLLLGASDWDLHFHLYFLSKENVQTIQNLHHITSISNDKKCNKYCSLSLVCIVNVFLLMNETMKHLSYIYLHRC
jgi:hypothetical protein